MSNSHEELNSLVGDLEREIESMKQSVADPGAIEQHLARIAELAGKAQGAIDRAGSAQPPAAE